MAFAALVTASAAFVAAFAAIRFARLFGISFVRLCCRCCRINGHVHRARGRRNIGFPFHPATSKSQVASVSALSREGSGGKQRVSVLELEVLELLRPGALVDFARL